MKADGDVGMTILDGLRTFRKMELVVDKVKSSGLFIKRNGDPGICESILYCPNVCSCLHKWALASTACGHCYSDDSLALLFGEIDRPTVFIVGCTTSYCGYVLHANYTLRLAPAWRLYNGWMIRFTQFGLAVIERRID